MPARLTDLLYDSLYSTLGMFSVLAWSFRVQGRQNIPPVGPVLLIGNHQSFLDIVMMGLACPRRTFFLAKKPLFEVPVLNQLMRLFGTVAVDLEGFSRAGLQGILQELKKGHVVLVYPEGERCWDGKMARLRPGVSLVIRKARCPIVPVGIAGAFAAWPRTRRFPCCAPPFLPFNRARIAVSVGKPIDGAWLAEMNRKEILDVLQEKLGCEVERAEKLRGNR